MATRRLPAHERRRQILIAAIRVFARGGFHGATTKEIAAEAEVAEALLYRYFESKQALFVQAMQLTASRMISDVEEILDRNRSAPDAAVGDILMYFKTIIETHEAFAKMVFVITAELDNPQIREVYLPYQEAALGAIESSIANWKAEGLIARHVPGRATAWVILGCFQIIALMKQTERIAELQIQPVLNLVRTFITANAQAHDPSQIFSPPPTSPASGSEDEGTDAG